VARCRLLWAPNPGLKAQPLDRIASGGELSRFMLAVVSISPLPADSTIVFDEVDAGVGGTTLNRVARKIAALAEKNQVILITHWPQLAGRANRHFMVVKEVRENQTFTLCHALSDAGRAAELRRMAGEEGEEGETGMNPGAPVRDGMRSTGQGSLL